MITTKFLGAVLALCCLAASVSMAQPSPASTPSTPSFTPSDTVLVRLQDVLPSALYDVRYATTQNFTKMVLYPTDTLWARKAMADALERVAVKASQRKLRLRIFDAWRPVSVQRIMWNLVRDERYVADPAKGSRHNRGAAVDLTLCTMDGVDLDMGTDYDDFTERAHVEAPGLTETQQSNRALLLDLMREAGFDVLPTEWWHYDLRGWEQFAILDV